MARYFRPTDLDEALANLRGGGVTVLAGGTDFYPARVGRPLDEDMLDITAIEGLRAITGDEAGYRIGALTTWTDLRDADLPPWFDGLKQAAREIGGVQVQNAATIVGNICNASPAADGVPPLLTLDAVVELARHGATRRVPLGQFITGNRATLCGADELVTGLSIPPPAHPARAVFAKLGGRRYLVISIVMVAALIEIDDTGRVAAARVAIGACAATALRLPALEDALCGLAAGPGLAAAVTPAHLAPLSPIDDMRGAAGYRRDAALTLTRRALAALGDDR
jgi:CO/xanthine dehydrogenase FAD-binding subunit